MASTKQFTPGAIRLVDALPKETNSIAEPRSTQPELAPHAGNSAGDPKLRASEIRYRRLFEAARDGILILDPVTLKIIDVNPFMTELLGYSSDEFLGRELWEIGLFNDKEASQEAFRELRQTGYIRYEDLPLQTKQGERREVEFVSNVYDEGTRHVIQCNIRDITARKRAEEERRLILQSVQEARSEADTANDIKDRFLALLSHELRTPLTSILGWSRILTQGDLDEVTSRRGLETIVRNASAQRKLIDDLLDISRIITGKLRLDVHPVELGPLIEAVVDGVRPAAAARSIDLHLALEQRTSPISGDPERLQQIIWNLLSNAIKFTPRGGRVEVRLERINSNMEITVSDTGQGIAPKFLLHVFERFRQADGSSTRSHGGLGLGLSIVSQLVGLHGGTVTAESPGEGGGAIFKVTFPLLSGHQGTANGEITRTRIGNKSLTDWQPSLSGLRVLVVDDEPDTRDFITTVLRRRDAEVVSVESAGEALTAMERQRFDVLVSDIGMPLMDGYELIQKVRQLPEWRGGRTPAAALTAYAGTEDRLRLLSGGYQIHVPKPVEPAELTAVVANLAHRYAAQKN